MQELVNEAKRQTELLGDVARGTNNQPVPAPEVTL